MSARHPRAGRFALAAGSVGALQGCREPTQITFEVSTDVDCAEASGTSLTLGALGELGTRPPAAITQSCLAGRIGSIVAVPGDEGSQEVAIEVVTAIEGALETCAPPDYGPSCIVARRALGYLEHEALVVPIAMREACAGVICPPDQTCVQGSCRSAKVDPGTCLDQRCDEGMLPPPAAPLEPWSQGFGSSDIEFASEIAVTRAGRAVGCGFLAGEVNFGSGPIGGGGCGMFLASLAPDGSHEWAHAFGDTVIGYPFCEAVSFDDVGNVYATGRGFGEVDFGGEVLDFGNAAQLFAASFDRSGLHRWSLVTEAATAGAFAEGSALAFDGVQLVLAGHFDGTISIRGESIAGEVGQTHGLVVALSSDGDVLWSTALPGDVVYLDGLAIDAARNIYLLGDFQGELALGDETLVSELYDAFVVSLTPDGEIRWAKRFGGPMQDSARTLAFVGEDRFAIAAAVQGTVSFGGDDLVAPSPGFGLVLAAFGLGGEHEWSQLLPAAISIDGPALAGSPAGNVLVAGAFTGSLELGSDTIVSVPGTMATTRDVFVARVAADGSLRGVAGFGSPEDEGATSIQVDDSGAALVTGFFQGPIDFGQGALEPSGGNDVFVARLPVDE